jgi:hypothetical protein
MASSTTLLAAATLPAISSLSTPRRPPSVRALPGRHDRPAPPPLQLEATARWPSSAAGRTLLMDRPCDLPRVRGAVPRRRSRDDVGDTGPASSLYWLALGGALLSMAFGICRRRR